MIPRVLPLRVFYFASFAALGAFAPFFPRWLVARGVEGFAMGATMATFPAMGLVGPPLVGVLADALGIHSWLLRFTSFGAAAALVVLAVVGGASSTGAVLAIFVAVLAHAAFRSPMVVMADVIAMERAPKAGVRYASVRNWGSVGSLVGAIGVGYVVDPKSPVALPAAVSIPLLIALGAALLLPGHAAPPAMSLRREARALVSSPDIPVFLATAFAAEVALSSYDVGFALRLGELGASSAFIGSAWAVGVVSEIVLMTAAGWLIARFMSSRLVVVALLFGSLRCALLGALTSLPVLAAIQPLHALSIALFWISSVSYIKARVAPHVLASAQGLFAAVMGAGSVTGMLIWGTLYQHGGGRAMFTVASVVALGAAALGLLWATRAHEVRQVV